MQEEKKERLNIGILKFRDLEDYLRKLYHAFDLIIFIQQPLMS